MMADLKWEDMTPETPETATMPSWDAMAPEKPAATAETGIFPSIRAYKESRVNDPSLGPIERGIRKAVWSVVPETTGQAVTTGIMAAASPITAPLAAIWKFAPAAARVIAGAGAGATGAAIDKGDIGTGALAGGGITAAIEATSPLLGKVLRSLPGMKGYIARQDAANLGQTIGEIVPPLAGAKTAGDLQNIGRVYGSGKKNLAGLFQDIDAQIGQTPVSIPTLGEEPVLLSDALKELSKLGPKGYGGANKNLMTRTAAGMDARATREQLLDEIRGEIATQVGPDYLAKYDTARDMYRKGNAAIDVLKSPTAYREFPSSAPILHTPTMQAYISTHRGELIQRLGQEGFDKLVDTVTRGGGLGYRDVLAPGPGGITDAFSSWLRGQNTGATQMMRVPLATVLPNIGSEYAGRVPFTPTERLKKILDILGVAGGVPAVSREISSGAKGPSRR